MVGVSTPTENLLRENLKSSDSGIGCSVAFGADVDIDVSDSKYQEETGCSEYNNTSTYVVKPVENSHTITMGNLNNEGKAKITLKAKLKTSNAAKTAYVGYTKNSETSGDVIEIGNTVSTSYVEKTKADITVEDGDIIRFWTKGTDTNFAYIDEYSETLTHAVRRTIIEYDKYA